MVALELLFFGVRYGDISGCESVCEQTLFFIAFKVRQNVHVTLQKEFLERM